jgi:uncharacterized protein (UPF0333 family)
MKRNLILKNESGQAITEYILLLLTVVGAFVTISQFIANSGLTQNLTTSMTKNFTHAYQYGNAQTLGFEDGGPKDHPRLGTGRMFINPTPN